MLITRTRPTDGMLKDKIDIKDTGTYDIHVCARSLLRQECIKGLARGHTRIKSWSLVVNNTQKVNNSL